MTNETTFMDNEDESSELSPIKLDNPVIENSDDQNKDEVIQKENETYDGQAFTELLDQNENSENALPLYKTLNPDIFDAELDSDEDEKPSNLASLPNKNSSIFEEDSDDSLPKIDPKLSIRLAKAAAKKEVRSKKSQVKNHKEELMEIHSETQRIIRESRVQIPYHNPEKQGISSVLEKIKQKREMFGLSKKSSLHAGSRASSLISMSQSQLSRATKDTPIPSLTPSTTTDLTSIKTRLNFGGSDDDENSNDHEDLMTRLLKNMQAKTEAEQVNEEVAVTQEMEYKNAGESGNSEDLKIEQSVSLATKELFDATQSDDQPTGTENKDTVENRPKSSKVRDLLNLSLDPSIVPKLGRIREGEEDDLIIEGKELTGVDKLFLRLETEMVEKKKKKKISVELCTASKLSTQEGNESFQLKKITYKMEEKTEVKISTRDLLKETLQSQMRQSRRGRLQERYEQYKQLGLDRGTLRLAEDHPNLPDDDEEEEDDFGGGDDSSCESSNGGGKVEEIEDEEEAAVERQEQANPFIEDEAEDDDGDDDDQCAVEGEDDDNNDGNGNDDDDDDDEDDDIMPVKKRCLKVIEDDEESSTRQCMTKDERDDDENIREDVNLFNEDAMSCQGLENEAKIPSRPFEDLCARSGIGRSTVQSNLSFASNDSRDSADSSSTGRLSVVNKPSRVQKVKGSLLTLRNSSCGASNVSLNLDPDWLFDAYDNQSVSQAIQGICSTQKNEDVANFCSGDFATQKDLTDDSMDIQNVPSASVDETQSRKRKRENDDEDESDDDDGAYKGDDDNEIYKEELVPLKTKGKINEEFVENEAELSGSEDEDDDDETGLDDEMDHEEGDDDDVGTEEELRKQVQKVHLKTMIDQDKREIRLLQEQLFEDGDLHDDDGLGRLRRFRWKNLDDPTGNDGDQGNASDDDDIKEGEDDAKWRMMRLERERFIQKQEELEEDVSKTPQSGHKKLKLVSSFVQENPVVSSNVATPHFKVPSFMSKTMGQKPVGSFLARSKESLSKFSDPSKNRSTFDTNGTTATTVSRNSRNFVFAHVSPSRKEEMKKENDVDGVKVNNNNKTPKSGKPPRKKQNLDKDTPLPPSRILKFLNE